MPKVETTLSYSDSETESNSETESDDLSYESEEDGEQLTQFHTNFDAFMNDKELVDIIIRKRYTCCNTCGTHDICQESTNKDYVAALFYHAQDYIFLKTR